MGFAKKIFYEVFGQRESSLPRRYDKNNVVVGDYVRVNNDGHSGVVLSRMVILLHWQSVIYVEELLGILCNIRAKNVELAGGD